jgi:hypothetical protein
MSGVWGGCTGWGEGGGVLLANWFAAKNLWASQYRPEEDRDARLQTLFVGRSYNSEMELESALSFAFHSNIHPFAISASLSVNDRLTGLVLLYLHLIDMPTIFEPESCTNLAPQLITLPSLSCDSTALGMSIESSKLL